MRKFAAIAAAGALCGVFAASPATSHAAVAGNMAAAAESANPVIRTAGCYRLGEYGYRWYPFCIGPRWLYPHHRVCRHGYCWYR
ncbi:MAG: hypothetical protein J2P53_13860 [Bradyrhizobiaceae bacterium]|nr:hypothetical protein [Bradyrhizobiaceae bacterium]